MIRATKILLSIYLVVSIVLWLQPPAYAVSAISMLVVMIVELAVDNARRKD